MQTSITHYDWQKHKSNVEYGTNSPGIGIYTYNIYMI